MCEGHPGYLLNIMQHPSAMLGSAVDLFCSCCLLNRCETSNLSVRALVAVKRTMQLPTTCAAMICTRRYLCQGRHWLLTPSAGLFCDKTHADL